MVKLITIVLFLSFNLFALDLSNTSFIDFVRFVSNSTNKNFIIDEDIKQNVSIIVPAKFNYNDSFTVLKSYLDKNDMYLTQIGSTYYIKKFKEFNFYSYKMSFLLPSKVIPIILKYYPAMQISSSKKDIIFRSSQKDSYEIKKLISMLDSPTRSKRVKITLISYKKEDLKEVGVNLEMVANNSQSKLGFNTFVQNLLSSSSLTFSTPNFLLNTYISNLETNQIIDTKFSPTLSLFDNEITKFSITQKIPFLNGMTTINGSNDINNDSYSYNDVGSTISIDKVSITDKEVYFHIGMQYEIILDQSLTPTTSKRLIDNYLKLDDNSSIVIAGITSNELISVDKSIPILSSIPYAGKLFEWQSFTTSKETFAIIISSISEARSEVSQREVSAPAEK